MPGPTCWGLCFVSGIVFVFALPGAVPVVGGSADPSVPRSLGAAPQEGRAASGPQHPAVTIPQRLCLIGEWFFVRCVRNACLVCLYGVFGFWGRDVVWFGALQNLPLVRIDVCCPLSLSGCLVCSPATFSLFLFLSGAGETQTHFGVWDSPCLFVLATIFHLDPYSELCTYT